MTKTLNKITFLIITSMLMLSCTSVSSHQLKKPANQQLTQQRIEESKVIEKFIGKHYGAKYVMGATGPNTFDCSGLMLTLFREIYKVQLPRTSMKQYYAGRHISKSELSYGDLVFFNTNGRGVSHVGVYLEDGKFGHASTSRGVMISNLSDYYFKNKFVAARRVLK
ncbi:MAG: C40 family peptidase [Candidatus Delongbacteria bacterium]|jgi:cell wall-associated NlpC family hydrolase|nr:C40 family peptidase [Candidatus Delongbacteria bacterium]